MGSRISETLGLDLRSLALFRIGLALLIFADLCQRAVHLSVHYSDLGVLPRAALIQHFLSSWHVSIHLISGWPVVQGILFLLSAGFALALLFGYQTRLATIACWFMLVSLHARNPFILNSGDVLLRLLLFWSMFLPLGARFSIDSSRYQIEEKNDDAYFSIATFALLLQICFVYWFTYLLKSHAVWRSEGTAVFNALSIEQYVTPLGNVLRQFPPEVLNGLTHITLWVELAGPLLLFIPFLIGPIRIFAVCLFISLHMGFGLFLELGLFSYISAAAWFVFLPRQFWEYASKSNLCKFIREGANFLLQVACRQIERFVRRRGEARPVLIEASVYSNVVAGLLILYVLFWNLQSIHPTKHFEQVSWLGNSLRLDQRWAMFAPRPLVDDGWYVIKGTLINGDTVDVFRGGSPLTWEKPKLISRMYKTAKERKYMVNLLQDRWAHQRPHLADFLWRNWNKNRPPEKQLGQLDIYFMMEQRLPEYDGRGPERRLLFSRSAVDEAGAALDYDLATDEM